jgi:hypothetical protein
MKGTKELSCTFSRFDVHCITPASIVANSTEKYPISWFGGVYGKR